jgi:N-acyl-D-amino-acid deacylase
MFDLLITGGRVLDGTGAPVVAADIGIRNGRVAEIGNLAVAEAKTVIRADGRYVCPGFIDAHSHSDAYLLIEPTAASKVYQGITTEVVGNCGASAAPILGAYQLPSDWRDKSYPGAWKTVAEYRAFLEQVGPAVNVALLIGHNTLRAGVAGYENRPLRPDELAKVEKALDQAMEEGGIGLSSGLIYGPGMFAPREELVALARVAARRGGIYTSHMRSEGDRLIEAIDEALDIGRQAGIRVEISHLKTSGKANWSRLDAALEKIERAQCDGVVVAADRYPYTASSTDLDVVFPQWSHEGGGKALLARLRDPADRAKIREALVGAGVERDWDRITIGSTAAPENRRFQGMALVDAAKILGLEPVDAVLRFAETDQLRTGAFFFGMNEANMHRILALPYVMIGSDASLRAPWGVLGTDYPHPRAYGAFARFLRMSLDGRTVPLPEAVRKMTSLPASHFGFKDRGRLSPGLAADVIVFDPATVRDTSDYNDPHRLATGFEHVIVNGAPVLRDGKSTGNRSGRFLPLTAA